MAGRWTRQQDATLRRRYRAGVPRQRIAAALSRSPDAVDARRRALGIPAHPRARSWSRAADDLVRAADAARLPLAEVARRLGRPAGAVRWRRQALGLQRRGARAWTPAEDQALGRAWPRGGDLARLGQRLGRSPAALRLRAVELGLVQPPRRRRWQPNEDRRLRTGYAQGLTCAAIAAPLPGRTAGAAAARARRLGLASYARRWTQQEEAQLLRLAEHGTSLEQAAGILVRTPQALRIRARRLGIQPPPTHRPPRRRRWTPADDELLTGRANLDPARLAVLLGRSEGAVRRRLAALGLRQGRERSPHHPIAARPRLTPAQQRLLAREYRSGNGRVLVSLANRLCLPPGAVKQLAAALLPTTTTAADPHPAPGRPVSAFATEIPRRSSGPPPTGSTPPPLARLDGVYKARDRTESADRASSHSAEVTERHRHPR
jgi:hypothetical protein